MNLQHAVRRDSHPCYWWSTENAGNNYGLYPVRFPVANLNIGGDTEERFANEDTNKITNLPKILHITSRL
jgi:hypothetical protein